MKDTTTYAQRRRKLNQDELRRRLRGAQYLLRLHEIAEKADKVPSSDVPALRLKADIYLRMLAKCLPDLKAVEHSGSIAYTSISDAELDTRIAQLLGEAGTPATAGGAGATLQ
ncbi:MAG: hypothetical protein VW362_09390 [Candidatus Nanopelagicales bacterium]